MIGWIVQRKTARDRLAKSVARVKVTLVDDGGCPCGPAGTCGSRFSVGTTQRAATPTSSARGRWVRPLVCSRSRGHVGSGSVPYGGHARHGGHARRPGAWRGVEQPRLRIRSSRRRGATAVLLASAALVGRPRHSRARNERPRRVRGLPFPRPHVPPRKLPAVWRGRLLWWASHARHWMSWNNLSARCMSRRS